MFSRRRWNYESNCAAIVCYVSTGLATSTTQLTELSDDILNRHSRLGKKISAANIDQILTYTINRILRGQTPKPQPVDTISTSPTTTTTTTTPTNVPVIHLKIFYQVNAAPPVDLLVNAIEDFRVKSLNTVKFAFTVLPACSLQNFSTFLSICGIKHE